jgi:LysR family transcriptional regulator, hydrogen peroxide-inducible genes activator
MADAAPFDPRATTVAVLRYVVAVDDHRHFGRAAAACHVAQPSLSALIAQWERRMDCRIFERGGRDIRPTPAGVRIIAASREALAALAAVESAAASLRPPFFGPVRLGVIPTVGPYALPFVLPALRAAFPDLDLPIREATTAALTTALADGELDIALVALLPGMETRWAAVPLYTEPFHAALPRGHAQARARVIDPSALAGDDLLLLADGHCLREQALELCRHRRPHRTGADVSATSLETLRQIVIAGGGVTLLPALATGEADPRLIMRPVQGDPGRTVGLIWRTQDPRGDAYRTLAGPLRRAAPRDLVTPA